MQLPEVKALFEAKVEDVNIGTTPVITVSKEVASKFNHYNGF